MTTNTSWLLPRTRVGRVGLFAACGCAVLGLFDVVGGWFMVIVVVTVGVLWTAILRHGDAALLVWLGALLGTGWIFYVFLGFLGWLP